MNTQRSAQAGKKTTGIILAVAGVCVCMLSSICAILIMILGQGRTEVAPRLVILFIIAALTGILSLIPIIAGVVLIATSAGKTDSPAGPAADRVCAACGTENPPDYGFCERCGTEL